MVAVCCSVGFDQNAVLEFCGGGEVEKIRTVERGPSKERRRSISGLILFWNQYL